MCIRDSHITYLYTDKYSKIRTALAKYASVAKSHCQEEASTHITFRRTLVELEPPPTLESQGAPHQAVAALNGIIKSGKMIAAS